MTIPAITMELYLSGGWVDITAKVRRQKAITVTRGRGSEADAPSAGTLTFTVDNSDGRFTFNKTDGVFGSGFKKWVPIRYTAAGFRRFTGFLAKAPVTWSAGSRALADAQLSAVDLYAWLGRSSKLASWAHDQVGLQSPLYWWPLDDPVGTLWAAAAAGGVKLQLYRNTTDGLRSESSGTSVFGSAETAEGDPQLELSIVNEVSGGVTTFHADSTLSCVIPTVPTEFTILLMHTPADGQDDEYSLIRFAASAATTGTGVGVFEEFHRDGNDLVFYQNSAVVLRVPTFFVPPLPRAGLVAIRVTATTISLAGTSYSYTRTAGLLNQMLLEIGPSAGLYSELAIIPGQMSDATLAALSTQLVGDGGTAPVSTWIGRALAEAGSTASVVVTFDRTMERPPMRDAVPTDVGQALANSSGSVFLADRNGAASWVDASYFPAVVALDATDFGKDLTWDDADSLAYTRVLVDGMLAADTGDRPSSDLDISGLLVSGEQDDYVTWLANAASIRGGSRISGVSVNLMPFDATKTALYLGLDVRSRMSVANIPPQLPTPMVMTLEGYTETLTEKDWVLDFTTAPDPSFVVEDDVTGLVESDYRVNRT